MPTAGSANWSLGVKALERFRQERLNFLRERTLRIRIQFELLTRMLQEAEAELAELEKADGDQAEGPLQDQG
jgi:hypothetical protein